MRQDPHKNASQNETDPFGAEVLRRREAAGLKPPKDDTFALALSGGGIRSATFCLGVVRGLAKNKILKDFDYLSTVSGGGYLGASLGRLYADSFEIARAELNRPTTAGKAQSTIETIEGRIAANDSTWLWWLRSNGRYLTPAGAKDLGFAVASMIRGIVSTNLEMGVLLLMLASLVILPHLAVSIYPPFGTDTAWSHDSLNVLPSTWAWLMAIPMWFCIYHLCAYWYTHEVRNFSSRLTVILVAATACTATACLVVAGHKSQTSALLSKDLWRIVLCVLLTAPIAATFSLHPFKRTVETVAERRLRHTRRLSYSLWGLMLCAGLVILERGSWELTKIVWGGMLQESAYRAAAAALVLAASGKLLLPEIQRRIATVKGPHLNLQRVINVLGIALSLAAALFWTTLLSVAVFRPAYREDYWDLKVISPLSIPPLTTFATILVLCLAYAFFSRKSVDFVNLSSLHNFYRARLERAYVSTGNWQLQNSRFKRHPLYQVDAETTASISPLTETVDGDDIQIADYLPHKHGGPIHLINCCINQSVDDRTGVYNADRKGIALTVSALGVEVGTQPPRKTKLGLGTLSTWIAISGAAASTGMGSQTSPGMAAVLFMSGIRLGYWIRRLRRPTLCRHAKDKLLKSFPKPAAIIAESLAIFPGLNSRLWYLSDGGHFDNTGIYALLKRRPSVIVAVDCGADPNYLFSDIESLVRKAKIDYGADITFMREAHPFLTSPLAEMIGTPETIDSQLGRTWLLLARIAYCDESIGTLIVVKPRRLDAMPFDLVAYADRNPTFPQQTTGDQFFDEAQWEAYHALGLLMGTCITRDIIDDAKRTVFHQDGPDGNSSLADAEHLTALHTARNRRRERAGLAVRATLGAGVSLSLLAAAWQGIEQYRSSRRSEQQRYDDKFERLRAKAQSDPLQLISSPEIDPIARESRARRDRAFDTFWSVFGRRCTEIQDASSRAGCVNFHQHISRTIPAPPEPFYDYWFRDKESKRNANADPDELKVAPVTDPTARALHCAAGGPLYVYIYDEDSKPVAQGNGRLIGGAMGATHVRIRNAVETGKRIGYPYPLIWANATLVYSSKRDTACAQDLAKMFEPPLQVQELRKTRTNTLELWLPPQSLIGVRAIDNTKPLTPVAGAGDTMVCSRGQWGWEVYSDRFGTYGLRHPTGFPNLWLRAPIVHVHEPCPEVCEVAQVPVHESRTRQPPKDARPQTKRSKVAPRCR